MAILFDIILVVSFLAFIFLMLSDLISFIFYDFPKDENEYNNSFDNVFNGIKEGKEYFYEHYIPILERINSIIPALDKNIHSGFLSALHLMQMEIHQMQDFVDHGYFTKNMFFIKKNKQFIHMHDIYNEQIKKIVAEITKNN